MPQRFLHAQVDKFGKCERVDDVDRIGPSKEFLRRDAFCLDAGADEEGRSLGRSAENRFD